MSNVLVESRTVRPDALDGALNGRAVLDSKIPPGPIEQKWDRCRFEPRPR